MGPAAGALNTCGLWAHCQPGGVYVKYIDVLKLPALMIE